MPPSTRNSASKKRTLTDVDPNTATSGPKSKRSASSKRVKSGTELRPNKHNASKSANKASSTTQSTESKSNGVSNNVSDTREHSRPEDNRGNTVSTEHQSTLEAVERAKSPSEIPPRVRYGPNGELFVPGALPLEAMNPGMKAKVYPPSCAGIDGIPGRPMTTGNAKWWAESREWLEKNAKALKFDEPAWRKKAADTKAKAKLSAKDKKAGEEADRKMLEHSKKCGRDDFDWVCTCRPHFDVEDERGEGSDDDSSSDSGGHPCGKNCVSGELASYHSDHKWILTLRGSDRMAFWVQEMLKRDQDDFEMHIYNDFSGYGIMEVLQNQLLAFDKAFQRQKDNWLAIWAELEGIAFFLNLDLYPLMMCDDSDGIMAIVAVIGHAVLNMVALMIEKGNFKANSSVQNLGLILALFIRFVCEQTDGFHPAEETTQWAANLVALADNHDVELNVLSSFEDTLKTLRYSIENREEGVEFGKLTDTGKSWSTVLKEYTEKHAPIRGNSKGQLGGTHYDITRMSAAEKKKYNIGGSRGMYL